VKDASSIPDASESSPHGRLFSLPNIALARSSMSFKASDYVGLYQSVRWLVRERVN